MNATRAQRKDFRRRFSPIPNFSLGYEWEMETGKHKYDSTYAVDRYKVNDRICKQRESLGTDGSLDGYNFEYASCIHNSSEFLGKGSEKERRRWMGFKRHIKMEPNLKAGLHTHIGLHNFTITELAKIKFFLYSYPEFFQQIAGGAASHYAGFTGAWKQLKNVIGEVAYRVYRRQHKTLSNPKRIGDLEINLRTSGRVELDGGKYHAMNIHPDYPTAEFRFIRTTDKINVFFGRMQLIIALCAFIKMECPSWRELKKGCLAHFRIFVEDMYPKYFPYLIELMRFPRIEKTK